MSFDDPVNEIRKLQTTTLTAAPSWQADATPNEGSLRYCCWLIAEKRIGEKVFYLTPSVKTSGVAQRLTLYPLPN